MAFEIETVAIIGSAIAAFTSLLSSLSGLRQRGKRPRIADRVLIKHMENELALLKKAKTREEAVLILASFDRALGSLKVESPTEGGEDHSASP